MTDPIVVPARFNGPPRSGNGGYVSGLLASHLPDARDTAVEVTLRRPIPLDQPLSVSDSDGVWAMSDDRGLLAEARTSDTVVDPIEPVGRDEATDATERYPGWKDHPFRTCFACGMDRQDGLRIFPGAVGSTGDGLMRMAAPWTPDESVADHLWSVTWAALDCIGGWAGDLEERPMLLGRMTGVVDALPRIGEPHVVMGLGVETDGRKTMTAATLVDSDGRVVARAMHTWIAVSAEDLQRLTA